MKRLLVLLLVTGMSACASADSTPGSRGSGNLIPTDEVRASSVANAYDLIQAVRPSWLRTHGAYSFHAEGEILVYLDDARLGGVDTLKSLELAGIDSIRFLDSLTASARFGLNHTHGAIQVRSVRHR
jgi:hypothetical protein